jgi:two-component system cell cycle response regulator CtrA
MRILIAAADVCMAASTKVMLAKDDCICDTTNLGEDVLLFSTLYDYDIILLDLTLADGDGYKMLQRLRAAHVHTPALIISARGDLDQKLRLLHLGADDFLTKPFEGRELAARILAIVRRSKGHSQSTIRTGELTLNLGTRIASVGGQHLHLSPKEYQILELLSLRKGTTLTKEMLLNHLYEGMDEPESKIIDVLVCKLRKKLTRATGGSHYIETKWGQGYMLRDPAAVPGAGPRHVSESRNETGAPAAEEGTAGQASYAPPQTAQPLPQIKRRLSHRRDGGRDQPVDRGRAAGTGLGVKPAQVSAVEMRFEDAVTTDGGPLRLSRPEPAYSLFGCATARCNE